MTLQNGYELTTTFWEDFTIADMFGKDAIRDTFKRAFREWKSDYVCLTELVIVLNHKLWQHWERRSPYAELYNDLWIEADTYACDNLQGDEYDFYLRITD